MGGGGDGVDDESAALGMVGEYSNRTISDCLLEICEILPFFLDSRFSSWFCGPCCVSGLCGVLITVRLVSAVAE